MLDPVLKNPWVRAAGALLALAAAAVLAWLLRPVLIPLFFAFIVAYALDPVVDFFERRRVRRTITIAALAIFGIALCLAVPLYLFPDVIHQSEALVKVAQERMTKADPAQGAGRLDMWLHKLPLDRLVNMLGWAPADQPNYDPLAVIVERVGTQIREGATDYVKNFGVRFLDALKQTGSGVAGIFASAGHFLVAVVLALGNFALFAFVAGYLLRDYDGIIASAGDLVPPARRARVFGVMVKIDAQLRGFMRGQAMVCVFLGVFYSIGLAIAGVPFALFLGVFGGAASSVPYIGILLTALPAAVLCIVQNAGVDWHLAVVVATFALGQFLEATVITPKLVGDRVGLGPVWVILAVLVFGNALGVLGLLLAVPTAAALKVLAGEALLEYKRSPLYAAHTKN